jgi:hypothetical protein
MLYIYIYIRKGTNYTASLTTLYRMPTLVHYIDKLFPFRRN